VAQVSLNDTEAERESLVRQVGELEAGLASLQPLAEERARLAEEVASLNKKNQFLFEELARERLRLESKIETLAEQGAKENITNRRQTQNFHALNLNFCQPHLHHLVF
jgi:hypothetical protein